MVRQTIDSEGTLQRAPRRLGAEVRRDFNDKASHALVASNAEVFIFEDLKLENMTIAPTPKQDVAGRWARYGSAAEAGLNKACSPALSTWEVVRHLQGCAPQQARAVR